MVKKLLLPFLLLALSGCALLLDASDEREVEGCVDTQQCDCSEVCKMEDEFTRACILQDCTSDDDCRGCATPGDYKCSMGQCVECDGFIKSDGTCMPCGFAKTACGDLCCNSNRSACVETSAGTQCCDTGVVCGSTCCPSVFDDCVNGRCQR